MLFGSQILDLFVGLILVYLLISLVASVVNEWIARIVSLRAQTLEDGLRNLLQDPGASADLRGIVNELYNHPLIQGVSPLESRGKGWLRMLLRRATPTRTGTQTDGLAPNQYAPNAPPAIATPIDPAKPLTQTATRVDPSKPVTRTGRPSYIEPSNFALALLDLVAPQGTASKDIAVIRTEINALQNERLRQTLLVLVDSAEADLKSVRANVEEWFNNAMERVAGWYKRKVQLIVLLVGLLLSTFVNADSVSIVRVLWTQPVVRDGLAQAAQTYIQEHRAEDLAAQRQKIETDLGLLRATNLPFGWTVAEIAPGAPMDSRNLIALWRNPAELLLKIVGLIVTGAAVSLGAPFWFETLGQLVKLRSTGNPPKPDDARRPA